MTTALVKCTQPGCDGVIQDGYCNTCGLAAPSSAASAPSGPSGSTGSVGSSSRSTRSRSKGRGSGRSARGRLGAGLVDIPPVPYRDPATAVLADPQVPEGKRYCSGCDQPVGRSRDGHYFRLVWTVDRSYISAAFGVARTCLAAGDRPGAIAALAAAPSTSSHHAAAQIEAIRVLVSGDNQSRRVSGDDLRQADGQLGRLVVDDLRRQQLTIEILRAALDWCTSERPAGGMPILGCEPNARAVRFGLERSYRALARLTPDEARRIELVDMANAIRPRTLT